MEIFCAISDFIFSVRQNQIQLASYTPQKLSKANPNPHTRAISTPRMLPVLNPMVNAPASGVPKEIA